MVKIEKQRYILFQILKEEDFQIDQQEILKSIWQSIWRYFGMREANKTGLWLLELGENYGIIRCSNSTKEIILTALTLIKEIKGKKLIFSPIKTSGTIKAIKNVKNLKNKELIDKNER
ncbi:MAG: Rpp14/Pop5 family protein [Promethearchaeota archaeon]